MTAISEPAEPEPRDRVDIAMQQWEGELGPEEISTMELCLRLQLVSYAGESRVAEVHRRCGLRPGDFDVLATLHRARDPYTAHALRSMLLLSKAGMSARVGRLVDGGLVSITPSPSDARVKLIGLTSAGADALAEAMPMHIDAERNLLSRIDPSERGILLDILRKITPEERLSTERRSQG